MFNQYTYNQLKKEEFREDIQEIGFASIGTQAGQFGKFTEHFRAISLNGANELKKELTNTAELIGVTYEQLMESMPQLKELLS